MIESAFGPRGGQKPAYSRTVVREWDESSDASKQRTLRYFGFSEIYSDLDFTTLPIEIQATIDMYLANPAKYPVTLLSKQ